MADARLEVPTAREMALIAMLMDRVEDEWRADGLRASAERLTNDLAALNGRKGGE